MIERVGFEATVVNRDGKVAGVLADEGFLDNNVWTLHQGVRATLDLTAIAGDNVPPVAGGGHTVLAVSDSGAVTGSSLYAWSYRDYPEYIGLQDPRFSVIEYH